MTRGLTLLDWVLLALAAGMLLPVPVVLLGVPGTRIAIESVARRIDTATLWFAFGAVPVMGLGCLAMAAVRWWGRRCFELALVVLGLAGVLWALALSHTGSGAPGAFSGLFIAACGTCVTAALQRRAGPARGFPVAVQETDSTGQGSV